MQRLKATVMMVTAELVIAIFSISYKVAANDDMHMGVLIAYRYFLSSIFIFPLALVLERNKRPKLTWTILFQAFVCTIFGGPMAQNMYAESLVLTSTTFVAAFTNLVPPITFIIAVMFGLEKVEIGKTRGKVKVMGTLIGVGGAMILTFYKGHQLNIKPTHFNLLHGGQHKDGHVATTHKTYVHHIVGSLLAFSYSLSASLYFILQSKLSAKYPCHYSNTFMYSVFGFIQSAIYVALSERSWGPLKLSSKTRLSVVIFQGISSLAGVILVMAVVHLQGPLFVSVFNPLVLVFVAIGGFLLLDEKLYMGSLIGSAVVIVGLYLVLWAKSKEIKRPSKPMPPDTSKDVNGASNDILTTISPDIVSVNPTSFSDNVDEGDDQLPEKASKHKGQEIVEDV